MFWPPAPCTTCCWRDVRPPLQELPTTLSLRLAGGQRGPGWPAFFPALGHTPSVLYMTSCVDEHDHCGMDGWTAGWPVGRRDGWMNDILANACELSSMASEGTWINIWPLKPGCNLSSGLWKTIPARGPRLLEAEKRRSLSCRGLLANFFSTSSADSAYCLACYCPKQMTCNLRVQQPRDGYGKNRTVVH